MTTRHHIIPRSRENGRPLTALVKDKDHRLYHQIFGNMTPIEIINWLTEYYWGDDWEYVRQAAYQHFLEIKDAPQGRQGAEIPLS